MSEQTVTNPPTRKEIVTEIFKFLGPRGKKWNNKGGYALDKEGSRRSAKDSEACKWCFLGACIILFPPGTSTTIDYDYYYWTDSVNGIALDNDSMTFGEFKKKMFDFANQK